MRLTARARVLAVVVAGQVIVPASGYAASDGSIQLVPHRAVYEISLDQAAPGADVARLSGRMVYELTGSACEGYTQNMRFVTRSVNSEGATTLSDMRASSWEEGSGKRFRFNSSQYQNQKLLERLGGTAYRSPGAKTIDVKMKQPEKAELKLPSVVRFPVQHSLALLKAASSGAGVMNADIFDGTEQGGKIYATTSIIGGVMPQSADAALPTIKNAQNLRAMKAWPVSISYFEKSKGRSEGVPIYEMAFRLYENGISRKLFISYESYAVRGVLSKLTYYKPTNCTTQGGAAPTR